MTLEDIFKEEETSDDVFDGFTTPAKEDTSNDIFDGFTTPVKEETKKEDNSLEKTLEIETLDLNVYLDKNQKIEKPLEATKEKSNTEETPKEDKESKKEKDHTIQESFINCSVLGFITAFMGAGWLINIINHI